MGRMLKKAMSNHLKWLIGALLIASVAFSCKRSKDDFSFVDDDSGNTVEVDTDRLVIIDSVPTSSVTVVEKGNNQDYFVSAKTPAGRVIKYTWILDGVTIQSGDKQVYNFAAVDANLGNHTLVVSVHDGVETETVTWSVKSNGPPVLTNLVTGTPKVSVGSSINLAVSATDPNNDVITYTWLLNGLTSPQLVGSGSTAVLTGAAADVGSKTIIVQASDGSAVDSVTFSAEVNHFPMACNELEQGEICTYAGNPNIGDGINPNNSPYDERIQPIAHCQDSAGNFYLADYPNHVMWFYNVSGSDITRHGVTITAGTMKVVAGSGEAVSGNDGLALSEGLYSPRAAPIMIPLGDSLSRSIPEAGSSMLMPMALSSGAWVTARVQFRVIRPIITTATTQWAWLFMGISSTLPATAMTGYGSGT